jgi:ADP-heptose:LPS heptosyltransferase
VLSTNDSKKKLPPDPKILLCCWASLGDVVVATTFIDTILAKFPKATIGFLCAPSSQIALLSHPKISYIHIAPNWRSAGKGKIQSLLSFIRFSFFAYPSAIKKIRTIKYDMSIELHPFFPDSVFLCKKADIPIRVGFTSSGSGPLLTKKIELPSNLTYLPRLYPLLLGEVQSKSNTAPQLRSVKNYIVLHMGTSDSRKSWDPINWHAVALSLYSAGYSLVVTGAGKEDVSRIKAANIDKITKNLCDKLSFEEFSSCLEQAALIITVDSVPIHLATKLHIPFVALYLYNTSLALWLPDVINCQLLIGKHCSKKTFHPNATYLEEITPSDVLSAAFNLL